MNLLTGFWTGVLVGCVGSPRAGERRGHGRHLHGGDDMSNLTCTCETYGKCVPCQPQREREWTRNGGPM